MKINASRNEHCDMLRIWGVNCKPRDLSRCSNARQMHKSVSQIRHLSCEINQEGELVFRTENTRRRLATKSLSLPLPCSLNHP